LGESEGRAKQESYEDNYYFFSTDYEKLNPITKKKGYTNYFDKLITDKIIDPREGTRIINKIQNTNEMTGYVLTSKHADTHSASQEMNNLYMKNKNDLKIRYMFGENAENKEGFSLGGLKNMIMESSELKEETMTPEKLEEIREMKKTLDRFSLVNTGICNALIFLDEKNNINDEYDNYNFNPWKAEWIYSPEYKVERKNMIHKIRSSMDYRGEISDEEDSIIKFDDKRDAINEKIKQMNDRYLPKRSSYDFENKNNNNKNFNINNKQYLENANLKTSLTNNKKPFSETNQNIDIKNMLNDNMNFKDNIRSNNNNNSELQLLHNINLFPKDNINGKK
jgi:hypothetical protein